MNFMRKLMGKDDKPQTAQAPVTDSNDAPAPLAPLTLGAPAAVNIWDLEEPVIGTGLPKTGLDLASAPAPAPVGAARTRRAKTRLLGFEKSDGAVVDLFTDSPQAQKQPRITFPVGWIVVIAGPGRGTSFALTAGMSQIGRGEDQTIALDFGDTTISRNNHAAIVYDITTNQFLLGHGGKTNIVRLNDQPVISNVVLRNGDIIRIGETSLRFVALCDDDFAWSDADLGKDDDVAFA